MFIGDLNYDCLVPEKSVPLATVCDIFDLSNLVKEPTCFTKSALPSLNDVILTNNIRQCMNVQNFNCGVSDVHNLISVQIKGDINQRKHIFKTYRSFKNFSEENFLKDLEKINFDDIIGNENIDSAYCNFETQLVETIDGHAPLKKRRCRPQQAPFMNKELRKAIYRKRMQFNKYRKCKTDKNWDEYRVQRNLVTKLKQTSVRNYFL